MKKQSCLILIVVFLTSCQKLKDYFPKPDPEPLPQFNTVYGGSQREEALAIIHTQDDGYLFTGSTESTDGDAQGKGAGYDAWVVKLNKSGAIQWQKALGGSSFEQLLAAAETRDGGAIVAGYTYSRDRDVQGKHGGTNTTDAWVVKLDGNGTIQWQKALGGSGYEIAYAINTTSDGGYVVAGYADSKNGDVSGSHGGEEAWIVKLDGGGNILWQKTLGGSGDDRAYGIIAATDGGYVIAAGTGSTNGDIGKNNGGTDAWVVKLDGIGNILWQTTAGGRLRDEVRSVTTTKEGKYLLAGFTEGDTGVGDAWVFRLNQEGKQEWQKTFGGSSFDGASSIVVSPDGGFAIAGYTESSDGDVSGYHGAGYSDAWVVKIDAAGVIQWQKAFGGTEQDAATAVVRTKAGGYTMAGYTYSLDGDIMGSHGQSEAWIMTFKDQ